MNSSAEPYRQIEPARISLQVGRHLVFGREMPWITREWQPREPAVLSHREQLKRVPSPAPTVSGASFRVENYVRYLGERQVVRGGKASLATAHDHNIDLLRQGSLPLGGPIGNARTRAIAADGIGGSSPVVDGVDPRRRLLCLSRISSCPAKSMGKPHPEGHNHHHHGEAHEDSYRAHNHYQHGSPDYTAI
jgi:hypothetical protein